MTPKRASPSRGTPDLSTRLHSAAIHLLRRIRREDDASGLTAPRLSALSVLVFGGTRTLGQLAQAEGVRGATMSRLVDALVEDGLAERTRDTSDGRVFHIKATPAGTRILLDARQRRVDVLTQQLDLLSRKDRAALNAGVTVLEQMLLQMQG